MRPRDFRARKTKHEGLFRSERGVQIGVSARVGAQRMPRRGFRTTSRGTVPRTEPVPEEARIFSSPRTDTAPKLPSFALASARPLPMDLFGFVASSGAECRADRPKGPVPSRIPGARATPWRWTRCARYREGGNSVHWITENKAPTGDMWNETNRLYGE